MREANKHSMLHNNEKIHHANKLKQLDSNIN